METTSSRDRMLAALSCEKPDYVPCCFMIMQALQKKSADDFDLFDRQLALGLDVRVELPDVPIRFDSDVSVRTWKEQPDGERVPLLHREYHTPSGTLTAVVRQTEDWPHGDEVPLFDDFLVARSRKFLVTGPADLEALRHLLVPPTEEDIAAFREMAVEYKRYAERNGLLLSGGWRRWRSNPVSVVGDEGGAMLGVDALIWLCGVTAPLYWAFDEPTFLEELIGAISTWDRQRLEIMLEAGAEFVVERGWYEGAELWSPKLFRRFIKPELCKKIAVTHDAGAKLGYILTGGSMPLLDDLLDLNIDVLIGVDPVQDKTMDLDVLVDRAGGKMCLWGGVCQDMTVELGTPHDVWQAVEEVIAKCGPGGGFILSSVENVIDPSQETWENVLEMIRAWQHLRHV